MAAIPDCGVEVQGERTDLKYSPCERLRRARGWSQIRLAGLADCGLPVIAGIEHGRVAHLPLAKLYRIARALGCCVADLVPGVNARQSEGGKVQTSTSARRGTGRARRELVRRQVMEMLRGAGGSMIAHDVVLAMRERYGIPEYYTRQVRRELGLVITRRPGRGIAAWSWSLPSVEKTAEQSSQ